MSESQNLEPKTELETPKTEPTAKKIELQIVTTIPLEWRSILDFQPKGFKVGNTDGIELSIDQNQLLDRFKVFRTDDDPTFRMFDGHTRKGVMLKMEQAKKASFPELLSCDVLQFKNLAAAAKALLQYQAGKLKISQAGLMEFANNVSLEFQEFTTITEQFHIETIDDIPEQIASDDGYEAPPIDQVITDIVPGDIFDIGPHRLACGDSKDSDLVAKLMDGATADMLITDPPYGVAYVGKTKDKLEIKNDALTEEQTLELWKEALHTALTVLKTGAPIYATVPALPLQVGFMDVMNNAQCLRQCMVWDKGQMVLGHSDYHYAHEPILYGWKPGGSHYFTDDRTKTTVLRYKKPSRSAEHPTMKPIELWAEMISNSSKPGAVCLDSFGGSGTTMVTCNQLGRIARLVELDPRYCQVIITRMLKVDPSIVVKRNGELYKPTIPESNPETATALPAQ